MIVNTKSRVMSAFLTQTWQGGPANHLTNLGACTTVKMTMAGTFFEVSSEGNLALSLSSVAMSKKNLDTLQERCDESHCKVLPEWSRMVVFSSKSVQRNPSYCIDCFTHYEKFSTEYL